MFVLHCIFQLYGLTDMDIKQMTSVVREKFRANSGITDFKLVDLMRHKGESVCRRALNMFPN